MKPDKDHIKDIFSSKLKGFEPEPPPSLWAKIEAGLPVTLLAEKTPSRTPIYKILVWPAAAAAVVLAVLLFMPQGHDTATIAALTEPKTIETGTSVEKQEIAESNTPAISKPEKEVVNKQTSPVLLAESSKKSRAVSPVEPISVDELKPRKEVVDEKAVTTDVVSPGGNSLEHTTENVYVAEQNKTEDFQPKDADFEQDLKERIAAFEAEGEKTKNILATNYTPQKVKRSNSEPKGVSLGISGGSGLSKADEVTNSLRYASVYNDGAVNQLKREKLKLEHNQPVSFGLAVNKKVTNRISLESGLMYTYVSARVKANTNSGYRQDDLQYFHYLGIPLSINYKLVEWKKIELYSSLGGMIQKDFYGKLNSDSSMDDLMNLENSSEHKISQNRPQFSATGLLGISYPVYNKLSVYTTFGGSYYFDAGNQYETIFSDKKWLFNLNLGVKFGF